MLVQAVSGRLVIRVPMPELQLAAEFLQPMGGDWHYAEPDELLMLMMDIVPERIKPALLCQEEIPLWIEQDQIRQQYVLFVHEMHKRHYEAQLRNQLSGIFAG